MFFYLPIAVSPLDPGPVFALLMVGTVLLTVWAGVLEILPGVHNIIAVVHSVIIQTLWLVMYWTAAPLVCLVRESERLDGVAILLLIFVKAVYLVDSYLMDVIKIIKNINMMKEWTKLEEHILQYETLLL